MAKIFLAGGTGHIGGAVLDSIYRNPAWESLTALVRDDRKAQRLQEKYPKTMTLIGDIDNVELVESAAKNADIVINTCPDISHEGAISVILRGLASRDVKGYYFHTSGAALIFEEPDGPTAGTKIWDDIADIDVITSLPDDKPHSKTDKLVFAASSDVNVAIISPTMVYGLSPSVEHPFPLTLPSMLKAIRSLGSGFTISAGENRLSWVDVEDLAALYYILVNDTLELLIYNTEHPDDPVKDIKICGPKAYYFAALEDLPFSSYMHDIVRELKSLGVLETEELKRITLREAEKACGAMEDDAPDSLAKHIAASYGVNMRVKASRARNFGWWPRNKSFWPSANAVLKKYFENEKVNEKGA